MTELGRGRLKLFLGYASGVGKSSRMLDEGRRRRERGQDVVVGALQPDVPPGAAELLKSLEIIPAIKIQGVPAMDVPGILRRAPQVCLIDGLAYDNPAGSRNPHRWQDVEEILSAGINVVGSINLQYIDDQAEAMEKITGKRAMQTVPRSFFNTADEIVIVDVSVETASEKDGKLREMALLLSADVIDAGLHRYLESHGGVEPVRGTQERFLIYLTPGVNAQRIVASALRSASRFHCDVVAVYVRQQLSGEASRHLEQSLNHARSAGARVNVLEGDDPIEAVVRYARVNGITQIFIGHSTKSSWRTQLFGSAASRLVREARGMDVRIFPH